MYDKIYSVIQSVDDFVWGWGMIVLLLGTHIFMTIRTGFIQRKTITKGIPLSVAKEEDALWESAGGQLLERYPADHILWMDEIRKFRAELFGYVQLAQIDLQAVGIRVGQLEIVKTFRQSPYQAHLLVNARGEMIAGDSRLKAKEQNGWQTVLLEGPKTGREGNA